MRCRSLWATLALLVVMIGAANPAAAEAAKTPAEQMVTLYGGVVSKTNPLLPIGTDVSEVKAQSRSVPSAAPPPAKTLTERGDVTAQRQGVTYELESAGSRPFAAAAPSVTVADCRARYPDYDQGYVAKVLDHYNFCFVGTCVYYTLVDGVVAGMTTWRCVTAGQGTKGARLTMFTSAYDRFVDVGLTNAAVRLRTSFTAGGYNGSDGSNPACGVNGDSPQTRAAWQLGNTAIFYVSSPAGDGYSRDAVSRCGVTQWGSSDINVWAQIIDTGVRMDSASYLGSNGAGIFDRVMPVMAEYATSSTRNGAVAQHIQQAQTNPASTYPLTAGKSIPGSIASGKPLHRLMSTWDAAASARYSSNRAVVTSTCAQLPHQADEECDEYPFASSWEGAGKGDGNFSVKYVNGTQNGNAGTDLNNWYIADRILHNDAFYVSIR